MRDFLIWFVVIFAIVKVADGYEVLFFDVEDFRNDSLYTSDYAYSVHYFYNNNECVNIGPDGWLNYVSSLERRSRIQCITLYSKADCQGDSVSVHQLVPGHRLIDVNFDKRLASFKDCEPKKVRRELSARPTFYLRVFDRTNRDITGPHDVFAVKTGECRTLPTKWQNRASSVTTVSDCFVLFDDTECKGRQLYAFTDSTDSKNDRIFGDLARLNFSDVTKSFKTCDLAFRAPCSAHECPKFLYDGSAEYKFWMYFLSVTSPPERDLFAQQVERSPNGLISWNFLLPSDWSTSSPGEQYHDAIARQHNVLRALIRPYRSNFNLQNVKTLLNLTRAVKHERFKQLEAFKRDYNDPNFALMSQMVTYWTAIERTLNEIIVNRFLENTDARNGITFYKDIQHRYEYKTYAFEDKCVNLDADWANKASSLEAYDHCITLYSKTDCKGDFVNIHPLSRGHQFLGLVNFDDKTVSFKKCEPNIETRLNERPSFYLPVKSDVNYNGLSGIFPIKSGECNTLPKEWYKVISSVAPDDQCYILFGGTNCTGQKIYVSPQSPGPTDLGYQYFANSTKSIRTCDLTFQGTCEPKPCPKFIEKGSVEYHFWMYYFSIYTQSYRSQFAERVKLSKSGFISWDFLFPSANPAATQSLGDQYNDALESQRNVIRSLRASRSGRWGFNAQNVETLLALASSVHRERGEQKAKFKKVDWNNRNYVVMTTMEYIWGRIKNELDAVVENWQSENADDICGLVGGGKPDALNTTSPLISDGTKAEYGDDPWHAAIYRRLAADESPILICGASLLSRSVLVSAAHCFYDEGLRRAMNKTSEYEIVVAKFTRDYKVEDTFQKKHKVREFVFGPKSYDPILTGTYGSDIILIVLEEPVTFDQYVRPVCLDWDGSVFASAFENETDTGRVVGWGLTSKDNHEISYASQYLLKAELPFISQRDCVGKIQHLTSDNFCGGSESGPGVRRGDSGGGFVFKCKGRYYLRGIVSTRDKYSHSSINAFTDISLYTSWIRNYV